MKKARVLIVDDEKSIRLTVAKSLETLEVETEGAVNGEEALEKARSSSYDVILLDLKLPGIDGMEVLRRVRERNRKVKISIITAHGTVENAVEAMKLGAVDFVQKPFSPDEIRELVTRSLSRREGFRRTPPEQAAGLAEKVAGGIPGGEKPAAVRPQARADQGGGPEGYAQCVEQSKAAIEAFDFAVAESWLRRAISANPSRAEAFNLLGVLLELRNDHAAAQKHYRAAIELDPTYQPACNNLERSTQIDPRGKVDVGGAPSPPKGIRAFVRRKAQKA